MVPAKIGHLLSFQARLDLPDVDIFFWALLGIGYLWVVIDDALKILEQSQWARRPCGSQW